MAIECLKAVLQPPAKPADTSGDETWEEVEKELGTRLPEDYKSFVDSFGTGSINHYIVVFNPFSSNQFVNLIKRCRDDSEGLGRLRDEFPQQYLHDLFPSSGGLLPFASTDNGEVLYWKTDGPPDQWTVVVYESRGPKYCCFDGSMTDFLVALLTRSTDCEVLPQSFPNEPLSFAPMKTR